jgi:predicted nuclease of predicted toxin-antitoxin system
MKLLFDQNISFRIIDKIGDIFPDTIQVNKIGLQNKKDTDIWNYARKNKCAIVTFDSDFYDLSIVHGTPPKIIWLRTGNTSTENIEFILRENRILIDEFLNNPDYLELSCLEIN